MRLGSKTSYALLVVAALASACAPKGSKVPAGGRAIDALRARAEQKPDDARTWSELASYEHFADGGDPARADRAIERATKLGADDLELLLTRAERDVLHGDLERALDGYLSLLARVPTSNDPLRAAIAESALASLSDMWDGVPTYRDKVRASYEALAPQADSLGLYAEHALAVERVKLALVAGDAERADRLSEAAGCVQSVKVAGPFGPRELLGFDVQTTAERDATLRPSYDLGPGRQSARSGSGSSSQSR